jgi:phosphatidylinositol alpha 1,6-mannosyltransferase
MSAQDLPTKTISWFLFRKLKAPAGQSREGQNSRQQTNRTNRAMELTDEERLEMGPLVDFKPSLHDRPRDDELRILIFTACYFVLDGVTLTIRRLEAHLRSRGAIVKIASTVPDEFTAEQTKDVIIIPGIKIPFTQAGAGYAFGGRLGDTTIQEIEEFNPTCVHFTVPDLVSLDGIRWCQKNNIPYMATWHSNYTDYLKYYCLEWVLKPGFMVYLQGFYEQMPAVYVPVSFLLTPSLSF